MPPPEDPSPAPAPAAAEGETPTGAAEEKGGVMEVEDRGEATGVEPVARKEGPDEEAMEEDGDGRVVGAGAGAEVAAAEAGDEEASTVPVVAEGGVREAEVEEPLEEEGEEVVEEDDDDEEEPDMVEEDGEEEEEPEEAEAEEDEAAEEDAAEVSGEGAADVDDMNETSDEEPEEAQDEGNHGENDKAGVAELLSSNEDANGRENGDATNDKLEPSLVVSDPVPGTNNKNLEIFVGGLPKNCAEEDIRMVFSQCGPIESITKGKNTAARKGKGIAFVRYVNIEDAKKALAEFKEGIEVNGKKARVSFAQTPTEYSEQLMKVKTVYLEHLPHSWDKSNIDQCCQEYGKIQEVRVIRSRKRFISFVEFTSRKSALACVEGINIAMIGDGEVKLTASIARPPRKVQQDNKNSKDGLTSGGAIPKDANKSKKNKDQPGDVAVKKNSAQGDVDVPGTSTDSKGKGKVRKRKNTSGSEIPSKKAHKYCDEGKLPSEDDEEIPQTFTHSKGKGKVEKRRSTAGNERPLKKSWNNRDGSKLPSRGDAEVPETSTHYKGKTKVQKSKNTPVNEKPLQRARKNRNMKHPAGPRYATNSQVHPSVGATSRSKLHARDLEPHAGLIPPANRVQSSYVRDSSYARDGSYARDRSYARDHRRIAPYDIHPTSTFPYARETAVPQPAYFVNRSDPAYQAGYTYTYVPPPPPPPSVSYHPASGPYISRRYYD